VVGFPGFPASEGLIPGTNYYWRIDEVNDANASSPWKGEVWSFFVPPRTAYQPAPTDGQGFVASDVTLTWKAGFDGKLHSVYFGDNPDDVAAASGALPQTDATYSPGALEMDKTYYWRVDEFDGTNTHKGDVWSFTTLPVIAAAADPNLIGWWTFDEGMGDTALDYSGNGHHGILFGPTWTTPGVLGDAAVNFSGSARVAIKDLTYASSDNTEVTVSLWIRTSIWNSQYIASFDRDQYWRVSINTSGVGPGLVGWHVATSNGIVDLAGTTRVDDGAWHHVCGVFDNGQIALYVDGQLENSMTSGTTFGTGNIRYGILGVNNEATTFNGATWIGSPIAGDIDDMRLYDRALAHEEIVLVMRGDPKLAWAPSPSDGSTPDIDNATPLGWSAGDEAAGHEVYFGTDREAVKNADTSETTGIYRGQQPGTSFTPAEGLEWGGGPYYWRVDENNADGTVTTGRVWSFTVADFILVDDFESYTDNDVDNEAIWQHWIDGYGVPANGSQVGYVMPPYAERTIVNGGAQSMPLAYNNTGGVSDSTAELTLTAARDWTRHGVAELSLWFRGYPASVGSFVEAPAGAFTMTAAGTDISGSTDEFHFAYRTLNGPGTIVAKVNSITDTHAWAKAGVMIRETLAADSKYALACITPGQGVASEGRTAVGATSFSANETGVTAPHWVKLERDAAGNFIASHSTNGSSWQPVGSAVPTNIPMAGNVYVGLAVTSHNAGATCEATFSNVTITGTAGGQWASQDIGISSNAPEPLYVTVSNSTGASATVVHDDPAAATIDTWTEWVIDLAGFADQGVNLADVDKIAVGLGGQGAGGGSGTLYIDDIRLYKSRPAGGE
ncbi:MAG: LamG domain-containing protein, partial [Planctomycetota bacterium]